jgi:hypothetical protein
MHEAAIPTGVNVDNAYFWFLSVLLLSNVPSSSLLTFSYSLLVTIFSTADTTPSLALMPLAVPLTSKASLLTYSI